MQSGLFKNTINGEFIFYFATKSNLFGWAGRFVVIVKREQFQKWILSGCCEYALSGEKCKKTVIILTSSSLIVSKKLTYGLKENGWDCFPHSFHRIHCWQRNVLEDDDVLKEYEKKICYKHLKTSLINQNLPNVVCWRR